MGRQWVAVLASLMLVAACSATTEQPSEPLLVGPSGPLGTAPGPTAAPTAAPTETPSPVQTATTAPTEATTAPTEATTAPTGAPTTASPSASSAAAASAGIAVGNAFTCAIAAGALSCWGANGEGQLGDETSTNRSSPTLVKNIAGPILDVSAGNRHVCALDAAGTIWCWGDNSQQQLGLDLRIDQNATPAAVHGLDGPAAAVSAGSAHTCAVLAAGGAMCWGANPYGQLGDGSTSDAVHPVAVAGVTPPIRAIAAGDAHTCAIDGHGAVVCWGANDDGQLGDGTTTNSPTPVVVQGLTEPAIAVGAGTYHSCALTVTGHVACWGRNRRGQLGDGTMTRHMTATVVPGLSGVTQISVGSDTVCAIGVRGALSCWGYNFDGELGDGTTNDASVPTPVDGLGSGVIAVATGPQHTCAMVSGNNVECWGYDGDGELGRGIDAVSGQVIAVKGLANRVRQVAAGGLATCAVTVDGSVQCWGYNGYGTLGDGTETDRATPGPLVPKLGHATAVTVGYVHACALTSDGAVLCWGFNALGQLGNGTRIDATAPVKVKGLAGPATAVVAGDGHTCALLQNGNVACWGSNDHGQLGVSGSDRPTATAVKGLAGPATAIAAGGSTTCALVADGSVQCWGAGSSDQLGNGSTTDSSAPVTVPGLSAVAVGVGYRHACAITKSGEVLCWGDNAGGDLGNGSRTPSATPVGVTGLSGTATQVVAGASTACVLIDGGAWCWGNNAYGQLGTNTYDYAQEAVAIGGAQEGLSDLSLSGSTVCAVQQASGSLGGGEVLCWGAGDSGQRGDGNIAQSLSPTAVPNFP